MLPGNFQRNPDELQGCMAESYRRSISPTSCRRWRERLPIHKSLHGLRLRITGKQADDDLYTTSATQYFQLPSAHPTHSDGELMHDVDFVV